MQSKNQGLVTKTLMLVLGVFLLLPAATVNAQNGDWRRNNDQQRRDEQRDRRDDRRDRRDDRRDRRRNRDNNDDNYRRNNGGYSNNGSYGTYGNRGSYGNNGYGNNGYGYDQSRQTALNAGYNEGIKEARRDRQRGDRYDYRDSSTYRNATKDYNSRLGDRSTYQQYFRQGFENGYRDGRNGY
jgi:hypothetical protein